MNPKGLLLTMICALTLAYAWGQDTVFVEPVDGPQITFSDPSKDLGTITQGEIVEHSFVFSNTGNQPLVISDVLVTCGCTVPEWPREPVAPGEGDEILVRFNSAGKYGLQNKVITVVSNGVNVRERLKIEVNVVK